MIWKVVLLMLAICLHMQVAVSQDRVLPTKQPRSNTARATLSDQASIAGEKGASAQDTTDTTELERGRLAFQASCTTCHEASRALEKTKSYAAWMETIRKMAAKEDAEIRTSDFNAIAQYLTANASGDGAKRSMTDNEQQGGEGQKDTASKDFDPALIASGRTAFNASCLQCHDAERSLSKSKSYSDWLSTVRRMAAKDGADISSSDFVSIATYLASQSGGSKESGKPTAEESGGWSFGTTVSTLHRSASDESLLENPGFFADVWATASYQSSGAWGATVTACTSCHSTNSAISSYSLELLEGSATVDLRKLFTKCESDCGPQLSLKAGRFPVPFGAFSAMSHPGVYRTVSVPLMFNMGRRVFAAGAAPPRQPVLPLPFADEGFDFILRQKLTSDINLGLDVYAVNGLQGDETNLFERSRAYTDNNDEPSIGLRTTLGSELLRIGGSLLHGGLHDQRRPLVDYTLWGVDATTQLTDKLRIYGEFARRRQDSSLLPDAAEKTYGVIAEAEYRIFSKPFISMIVRYDTLEHRSQSFGDATIERLTSGFNVGLPGGSLLMIDHEHWQPEIGRDVDLIGVRWSISL